ncbi:MAG: aspartate carbamoyltransferase [Gammaproteobacteria bacterium]|jgi:aspartate carbamoyltransferase catalytic subunit|nr:aspartate carbamoyltransferase [Gammaproteobacteria bacterium]MBT3869075.1 aspartate carbamoyltransferase [Gammaproteobacteria bacterium]MBT5197363.1 aspartate carbamoyltransferase [Gammaproteobacteria bacterium]MBT5792570.1 aspartate carbamoyltransferase [Gammaproteobacteria bacterium]MBT6667830.1 aspartate carbamoyltransferase [Gammaproteobacteria bacterium]
MNFIGSHILSVSQFQREDIETVFNVADNMIPYANRDRVTRVLEGAILGNMFFEPSTRTRVSFGCAWNLLGGEVRETTEVKASAIAKGESFYDTARVLSGYSDIIVMRHQTEGSVEEFSAASRVPVINGGDGSNEHPSQALLDLYTIRKEMEGRGKTVDNLRIALIGDLRYGRAVHSLCKLLSLYKNIHFTLISPAELRLPETYVEDIKASGHVVVESEDLQAGIAHADILYVTRTQEERFPSQEEADKYKGLFRLNQTIYTENCEPNTVIMHPLPRDSRGDARELDDDLNENPNLAIFRQTDNGVVIRMALFALILDVVDQVEKSARDVNWYTAGRFR